MKELVEPVFPVEDISRMEAVVGAVRDRLWRADWGDLMAEAWWAWFSPSDNIEGIVRVNGKFYGVREAV